MVVMCLVKTSYPLKTELLGDLRIVVTSHTGDLIESFVSVLT